MQQPIEDGRVNFLDDASLTPHCKPTSIYKHFGIAESTGQNKSKEIRDLLRMGNFSPERTLPSQLANKPMAWMIQLNGFIIDARDAPVEVQIAAVERGLIPICQVTKCGSTERRTDEAA